MQNALDWSKARWAEFRKDVWEDPSIGPVAGILLSMLAALIAWLTMEYAPGAAARADIPYGEAEGGSIDPLWGRVTIVLMTIATLTAGFEPIVAKHADRWWRRAGKRWWKALAAPIRWLLFAPIALILIPAKLASFAWSFVDFVLARPIAILAGAAWRGWVKRYAHFGLLMALAVGAVVAVEAGRLAPNIALAAIAAGLVAILAIVRRWSWIESDRDTFLIERGEREEGKGTLRIGFKEDLRDEALLALACLFFLIPLGLDLVQQATTVAGVPAFAFDSTEAMPSEPFARFITWLGYFGAELAKTVPFVDWSEVFHVANGSPIEAQTPLGSQLAFVLRAGLDLLFLAAVLQAVQIATRLREQRSAFYNNRLPILEPFTERVELARAFVQIDDDLDLRPSAQATMLDFPSYDGTRLKELIDGTSETKDLKVRKAAAALLQKNYEAAPDSNPDTPRFWTERVKAETDEGYRGWLLNVASGVDPDEPARMRDAARRARLLRLIEEDWHDARARAQAVRQLGRSGLSASEGDALLRRLSDDKELAVKAAAAVALAKAQTNEAFPAIAALIGEAPDGAIVPAQALAFALAHQGASADEIAARFAASLRPHAHAAALIQRAPMDIEAGKTAEKYAQRCQSVAITPGHGPFPDHFIMGDDNGTPDEEKPQRRVAMSRAFALGRFAVTQGEYRAFTEATGQSALRYADNETWPAIEVSWFDAQDFCRWLEAVTGEAWRLPTESEWEYACRAGSESAYSWGPDWGTGRANSNLSQPNGPREVGSYRPNDWGFWDMHGNVHEWCVDPWHPDYRGDAPNDQMPWLRNADFSSRVVRGGSWSDPPDGLRSAARGRIAPLSRGQRLGFRFARTVFTPES